MQDTKLWVGGPFLVGWRKRFDMLLCLQVNEHMLRLGYGRAKLFALALLVRLKGGRNCDKAAEVVW